MFLRSLNSEQLCFGRTDTAKAYAMFVKTRPFDYVCLQGIVNLGYKLPCQDLHIVSEPSCKPKRGYKTTFKIVVGGMQ